MEATETEIVEKAREGDVLCFTLLVEKYKNKIYGLAFSLTRDSNEAEEVSQRVFIKLWNNINKFSFESAFSTWVYRVAYNTFLNYTREKKRYTNRISLLMEKFRKEPPRQPSSLTANIGIKEAIASALSEIPGEFALIVIYYDVEEMSYAEISGVTGLPEGTVKSRLSRGRKLLRERLGNIHAAGGV